MLLYNKNKISFNSLTHVRHGIDTHVFLSIGILYIYFDHLISPHYCLPMPHYCLPMKCLPSNGQSTC